MRVSSQQAAKEHVLYNWKHIDSFTTLEDTDQQRKALEDIVAQIPKDDPMRRSAELYTEVLDGNPDLEQHDKEEFMRYITKRVLEPDTEHYEELPLSEEDLKWRVGQIIAQQRLNANTVDG